VPVDPHDLQRVILIELKERLDLILLQKLDELSLSEENEADARALAEPSLVSRDCELLEL
jgi:hypothetical protein